MVVSARESDAATWVRRAGAAGLVAVASFIVLFAVTGQVGSVRSRSPWSGDPYDAVVSYAAVIIAVVAPTTLVRCIVHRRPRPVSAHVASTVLAGCAVMLGCTAAAALACLTAVAMRVRVESAAGALPWLPALPAATLALTAAAMWPVLRAWRYDRLAREGTAASPLAAGRGSGRPDLLDDVATLAADVLPGSVVARWAAWLGAGLDRWRWSPRRYPRSSIAAVAAGAGLAFAGWHALVEGPWANAVAALVFAAAAAGAMALGLGMGVAWLGLLRRLPHT